MIKRSSIDDQTHESEQPQKKARHFDPNTIHSVISSNDLDTKVLIIQNSNLASKLGEVRNSEAELINKCAILSEKSAKQEIIIGILLRSIRNNNRDVKKLILDLNNTCAQNINQNVNTQNMSNTCAVNQIPNSSQNMSNINSTCVNDNDTNNNINEYKDIEDNFETAYSFVQRCRHSTDLIISDEIKSSLAEGVTNIKNLIDIIIRVFTKNNENSNTTNNDNITNKLRLDNISYDFLKNRALISEFQFVKDRYSSSQEEINKLQENIEELTSELTKKSHRYEVLLNSYNNLIAHADKNTELPQNNKATENNDEIKLELISIKEIAHARLEELKMLQTKFNETVTELNRTKISNITRETDAKNSPEYKTLSYQLECAISDAHILKDQLEHYKELVEELIKQRHAHNEITKKNLREFRSIVKESLGKLNKELYNTKIELYKNKITIGACTKNFVIDEYFIKMLDELKNENSALKTRLINDLKNINDNYGGNVDKNNSLYNNSNTKDLNNDYIDNDKNKGKNIHKNNNINNDNNKDLTTNFTNSENNELQLTNKIIIDELENLTSLYEQIKARNIELMAHIKENETAQLNTLTENLKLVQQLKTAIDEKENILLENNSVKMLLETNIKQSDEFKENYSEFMSSLDVSKRETEAAISTMENYKKKLQETMFKYVESNTQLEKFKITQESERSISAEWEARFENESFKNRRLNEDLAVLRRKLEKAHSNQYGGASDRILVEEVRMLKHKLTCHCCNARPKDAILTKCFHLFCFECLATTYNNRQRKCPRCGQSFGSHDFHKIYF